MEAIREIGNRLSDDGKGGYYLIYSIYHSHSKTESAKGNGATAGGRESLQEAIKTAENFNNVGATSDEWTFVDSNNRKDGPYNVSTSDEFIKELNDGLLLDAERGGVSLVVRPRGGIWLQIDDVNESGVDLLKPFCFLVIETSKGNFQAWMSFTDEKDKAAASNGIFERLKQISPTANPGSGSMRWPGCVNFKEGREYFRVRLVYGNAGRSTSLGELVSLDIVSPPPPESEEKPIITPNSNASWPDYELCLEHKTIDGKEHPGRADALFVYRALLRGHSPAAIAAKLMECSKKARFRGKKYVNKTIESGIRHLKNTYRIEPLGDSR